MASAAPLFLIFPYAVKIFLPFIIGAFFYFAAMPLNVFLLKKKIPPSAASAASLTVITVLFGFFSWFVLSKAFSELIGFAGSFQDFYKAASDAVSATADRLSALGERSLGKPELSENFGIAAEKIGEAFRNQIGKLAAWASEKVIGYAKNLPNILLVLFTAYLSAFFMLRDNRHIKNHIKRLAGERNYEIIKKLKASTLSALVSYLRAQFITGGVVFCVLLAGFLMLRVRYALLFAFVTAVIDAVPVLGTGTVLLPWSLFKIFSHDSELGWGLLCLYGICTITRRICEPKILGRHLGIHPLAVIFSVYAGMKIFGFIGIIAGPTAIIAVKNLLISSNKEGSSGELKEVKYKK